MKQAQIKRFNGTHSNFRAEWLNFGSPRLTTKEHWGRFNYCNAVRSSSEIQTSQCYCDVIIPKNTKVH